MVPHPLVSETGAQHLACSRPSPISSWRGNRRFPFLLAVEAAWDGGPAAGRWIGDRLGPFGPSVVHAVPLEYEAYAVVPVPLDDEGCTQEDPLRVVEVLLDALAPFTVRQPVHFGMWDGWSWWHETDENPRTKAARSVVVTWPEGHGPPSQAEVDRVIANGAKEIAAKLVERPDGESLELPHRNYHLWTGPLESVKTFAHEPHNPPSLIWPQDSLVVRRRTDLHKRNRRRRHYRSHRRGRR